MSDQTTSIVGARPHGYGQTAARWLSLAAAPAFAIMALLAAAAPADILCVAMQGPISLQGMVPMYALMSAFHLAPWLRLLR
ncbi:hypothetical protein MTX26_20320 [Bradyrhizobium sp. ISRA443]|uniref:hypothetical protein n=1 Tax=unclassified Bradyrhizobium TaxID=2631580 RepID=UPI00247984A6|nr:MULTISPECIES: hypothetical protein [unclassified Bradyrhizobium]WGR92437.1 hypothetical protein MTX20_31010 [Bradyrhizobium sp. ISRA435]WGR96804.1 hypothetical protein MTX23_20320 [Bradyrhizobium sp. ISRA436]WGS03692.1 hypothetical protein MTX18_20320 [Bradyrhizobium sp. ISRA437]WGS10576.1 hypothetical protein MTX26_20320 [Bradyrhizobium sp. ISRA443]